MILLYYGIFLNLLDRFEVTIGVDVGPNPEDQQNKTIKQR